MRLPNWTIGHDVYICCKPLNYPAKPLVTARVRPYYTRSPPDMPVPTIPPFPDDVPVVPLLVIDYKRILARDEEEVDRLWEAATKLGFW